MGVVLSTLDRDATKVSTVEMRTQGEGQPNTKQLQDYANAINKKGFILMKIDLDKLKTFASKMIKSLQEVDGVENPNPLPPILSSDNLEFGNLIFGLPTLTMFYTLVSSNSGSNFQLLIPKGLLLNDDDYFAALEKMGLDNISGSIPSQSLNMATEHRRTGMINFRKIIAGFNKNTTHAETRIANFGYFVVNSAFLSFLSYVVSQIAARDPNSHKRVELFFTNIYTTYLAEFLSTMPDNQCLFSSNDMVSFTPDICKVTVAKFNNSNTDSQPAPVPGPGTAPGTAPVPTPGTAPGTAPGTVTPDAQTFIPGVSNTIVFIGGAVIITLVLIVLLTGGRSRN